jgi:hypothetical protein
VLQFQAQMLSTQVAFPGVAFAVGALVLIAADAMIPLRPWARGLTAGVAVAVAVEAAV